MRHNVGSLESYARMAGGIGAAASAWRMGGWPRVLLGVLAVSGIVTALTRYCPINEAMGRHPDDWDTDEGAQDARLRRQMSMASALGTRPSSYAPMPRVTEQTDVFGRA